MRPNPNCNKTQSRLNKGGLCKGCNFSCNDTQDNSLNRTVVIKESKHEEVVTILREQVEFLKGEITVKNTMIKSLMFEMFNKSPEGLNDETFSVNTRKINEELSESLNISSPRTPIINNRGPIENHYNNQTAFVNNHQEKAFTSTIMHPNRFAVLQHNDNDLNAGRDHLTEEIITNYNIETNINSSRRPAVVTNKFPEQDNMTFRQPKLKPGNNSYADITSQGRKILLLSDSTLGRVQMAKLNNDISIGKAYRKYFPGAIPTEMTHYSLYTLQKDKPDVAIIHTGTNSLPHGVNIEEIGYDILNLVNVCRANGVNEVLVSGIVFRHNYNEQVREFNNFLDAKKYDYDFTFINNDNIGPRDIGNDRLHLNYNGIKKIANNILDSIDTLHS